MNKTNKRIFQLQKQLKDFSSFADGQWMKVIDTEWDAHHCDTIIISDTIEEYQILRFFDIEIQPIREIEDLLDTPEKEKWWFDEKNQEDYQAFIDTFYDGEPYDAEYSHESAEYKQIWINLKNGKTTTLGKIYYKNPTKCDFDGRWWLITGNKRSKKAKIFEATFKEDYGSGFYYDANINPLLIQYGYQPIDATNWSKNCGSEIEDNRSGEAKFIYQYLEHGQWENFLYTFANGKNPVEQTVKNIGLSNYIYSQTMQEQYKEDFITACKIASRHHYQIPDLTIWRDMVTNLCILHKDVHNPKYVCPKDLAKVHISILNQVQRQRDKIEYEKKIKQAIIDNEHYIQVCQKFLDIVLESQHIVLKPLQSVPEFLEEGIAMHHCVYTNGYYRQNNTLILSARDHDNNRVATIELNTNTWEIKQVRAACNKTTPYDSEIRKLITDNIQVFKTAKRLSLAS